VTAEVTRRAAQYGVRMQPGRLIQPVNITEEGQHLNLIEPSGRSPVLRDPASTRVAIRSGELLAMRGSVRPIGFKIQASQR
jgi:hypothetical protein